MNTKINDVWRNQWRRVVSECLRRDPGLSKPSGVKTTASRSAVSCTGSSSSGLKL